MKRTTTLITGMLTATTALSGTILTSTFVSADDVVDEINITVPVSCSLSGVGMNTHNATINNGQYDSAIGETTIKAFCNDSNGFAIYAIGYTDDTDGNNVLTSSTLGSDHDIVTGTATSGNTSNWAMKLSTITSPTLTYPIIIAGSTDDTNKEQGDPDYSSFQEVPDDYALVAKRTSGTDIGQSAEGATIKTTYQAYVSPTQSAGTYTGQVKYTLVHPHNATKPIKPVTIATAEYLQEVNSCPADLPEEQVYTLKDSRDEQEYKVAKLKDGKCWMVENLNIAGGTALSSTDTDFDASYTLPTTGGWTVADGKLILPASAIKNENDNNLTDSTQFSTDNYAYIFNSGNKENCGESNQNIPCYSYYSWDAATLGSGRNLNIISTGMADAPNSLCPKGWKLPSSKYTSDAGWQITSDLYVFAHQYGLDNKTYIYENSNDFYLQAGPGTISNMLLARDYTSGLMNANGIGQYWSSTTQYDNPPFASTLLFNESYVTAGYSTVSRKTGNSVRCLLKTN